MVEKRAKKFGHPLIRAMPERKRFFPIDVFPKCTAYQIFLRGKTFNFEAPHLWPT